MGVDRAVESFEIISENAGDEMLSAEDATGLCHEDAQDADLGWRELDALAIDFCDVLGDVDCDAVDGEDLGASVFLETHGPPEHSADAGCELTWTEGLGHVIVGANVRAREPVLLFDASGEHDDGDVRFGA